MKKKDIIITKHALEEFIKDHPDCKNPESVLKNKFLKCLFLISKKKAFYSKKEDGKRIVKYRNFAIVYNKNKIITYYKAFSNKTIALIKENKNLIENIFINDISTINLNNFIKKLWLN